MVWSRAENPFVFFSFFNSSRDLACLGRGLNGGVLTLGMGPSLQGKIISEPVQPHIVIIINIYQKSYSETKVCVTIDVVGLWCDFFDKTE